MKKSIVLGLLLASFAFATNHHTHHKTKKVHKVKKTKIKSSKLTTAYLATILPKQDLSEEEKNELIKLREEEKLARDVYITLYNKWHLRVFRNISKSEQQHMNAIKALLDKYNLPDPVEETKDRVGVFKNPDIQKLYYDLVAMGSTSKIDALTVGATIEDLDIADLEKALEETDNDDIKLVFTNLKKGSRNHLRAFTRLLKRYKVNYTPQYISYEEYEAIINSPHERGVIR